MSEIGAKTRILVNDSVFEKDDSGVGQTLITALANFIVPLIQGDTTVPGIGTDRVSYTSDHPIADDPSHSADGAVRPGSALTIEGQDLLIALKRFAVSLAHSPSGQHTEPQSPGNLHQLQGVSSRCGSPRATDSDASDVVESGGSEDVQPLEGWDAHMWESSGLGLTTEIIGAEIDTETSSERQQWIDNTMAEARDTVFNKMPIRLLMFDQDGKGITLVERSELMKHIFSETEINSITKLRRSYPHSPHLFEQYAILSHTWLPRGEVTYAEWRDHTAPLDARSPGYDKLAKFCEVAAKYGLRLAWMDTVCINKESSAELDESIRSMFKWYKEAKVCIAYLADTTSLDDMEKDKWFTRGWTLQELLAPCCIKFFSKSWTVLSDQSALYSDKSHGPLISKICDATGLHEKELFDSPNLGFVPIWRKMQWAANRNVTREEDTAYSLMGMFDISMPTGYGEGVEHAFLRLVREILNSNLTSHSMLEIANWNYSALGGKDADLSDISPSDLIPKGPHAYAQSSSNGNIHFYRPSLPITLSHMGLCVPVLLMPSSIVLNGQNNAPSPKGDYSATCGVRNEVYKVLDGALFSSERSHDSAFVFAVLNIAEKATEVLLPENGCCLAIQLWSPEVGGWKIPEDFPFIVYNRYPFAFDIVYHNNSSFKIPKDKLNHHGMSLRTVHL